VYSKEAYAPFGETYNESGTPDRSFTRQDQNVSTGSGSSGEYDFLFRKYDPSAGRWLSPDPAGWKAVAIDDPQSLDRYSYVENQPMSSVDPTGQWWCFAAEGVSGGVSLYGGFTCYQDRYGQSVLDNPGSGIKLVDGAILAQTGVDGSGNATYSWVGSYWYVDNMLPKPLVGSPMFGMSGQASMNGCSSNPSVNLVRNAAVAALAKLNPGIDESNNITALNYNFAKVANPSAVPTNGWHTSPSIHGTSVQSPIIPGQDKFVVKMYRDPGLGNTIAVVYPTMTPEHFGQAVPFLRGQPVNSWNARAYVGCD
jgi:RHS repeat-associated protein